MPLRRAYDNSKREQARLRTRAAIVEAMVARMGLGDEDIPVAELAEEAGVSRRTVYQHFPDKAARIEAINDWIDERVDVGAVLPRSFEDVPAYVERLVAYMLDNEALVRLQLAPGLSKQVRSYRKRVHARALRRALGERVASRRVVEDLTALILCTVRVEAVLDMRDLYGMSKRRSQTMMRRMVTTLLAEVGEGGPG